MKLVNTWFISGKYDYTTSMLIPIESNGLGKSVYLKLTQDEKGNWKIEENPVENNNKSSSKKSSPKSRKGSKEDSDQPLLLRRPSIKKIKAFFQKLTNGCQN